VEGAFPRTVSLTQELHDPAAVLAPAYFVDRALAAGLTTVRSEDWPTIETSLSPLGEPLFSVASRHGNSVVCEFDGALLLVNLWGSHLNVTAATADASTLDAVFEVLHERFRTPDPSSANDVPVTFWTYTPQGPQPAWRAIGVPGWDDIRENYAASTRDGLEAIMRGFQPAHGGQLILWHGPAGTGKTFALRALAWEWRDWCQLHYIVDPDAFFGQHADYLMSVLLQPDMPMITSHGGVFPQVAWASYGMTVVDGDEVSSDDDDARLWRVLVLEDTGELITAGAREAMGQALSRFLNVVDGLIGQGLRILVLVTTNEEIRILHPAVARPGRCAANIEFTPLEADEAAAWLRRHGVEPDGAGQRSLASLYAQLEGRDPTATVVSSFAAE
jgi:hypothetical protein